MKTPPVAATNPSPTFRTRGVIEGFYGRPYSWDERATLVRFIGARDMNTYVYAPKDDPLHRAQWRDLYARADIEGFARLARTASACVAPISTSTTPPGASSAGNCGISTR